MTEKQSVLEAWLVVAALIGLFALGMSAAGDQRRPERFRASEAGEVAATRDVR